MFGPNVVTTASQFSGDNYAPNDARMPKIIGMGAKGKGKKKKQKIPIIRRSLVSESHVAKTPYLIRKDGISLRDGSSDRDYRGYAVSWAFNPLQAVAVYRKKMLAQGKSNWGNFDAVELTPQLKDKIDSRFAPRNTPAPSVGGPKPVIDGTPASTGGQLTLGLFGKPHLPSVYCCRSACKRRGRRNHFRNNPLPVQEADSHAVPVAKRAHPIHSA